MIIAGNWKMNLTLSEGVDLLNKIQKNTNSKNSIILFPSFTLLYQISSLVNKTNIFSGSQDCSFEENGAFTGDISTSQILDSGCNYCLIGHSERRKYHNEIDSQINLKAKKLLDKNLTPLICIGENIEHRNAKTHIDVIKKQIDISLNNINLEKVIIAYEPVWAIGTGLVANNQQIEEIHNFIIEYTKFSSLKILYGGSVNEKNYSEILSLNNVSGVLVGGASLNAEKFIQIANF